MFERVGVLCLGALVGYLLAVGLANTRPTVRVVVTILGAALGGVPVAFLAQSLFKWVYPLGLVAGFLMRPLVEVTSQSASREHGSAAAPSRSSGARILLIASALVVIAALALALPDPSLVTERGEIVLTTGMAPKTVHYSRPFERAPALELEQYTGGRDPASYHVEAQDVDGFVFVLDNLSPFNSGDIRVSWTAQGRPGDVKQ